MSFINAGGPKEALSSLRVCLHEGEGSLVGELTRRRSPHLAKHVNVMKSK